MATTVDELYKQSVPAATAQPNPALVNPYTRGIIEQGIKSGTLPAIDFDAETAKRIESLKATVVPETQALMSRGLEESQRLYQRTGKLGSSAALYGPNGMVRTTEGYALQAGSQLQQGVSDIYSQIGTERTAERGNIYGLSGAEMTANISAESQQKVADIQSRTDRAIAQVNADTTMLGYDKQIQITQLQNQKDLAIAGIQAGTTASGYNTQTQIAQLQAETDKTIAAINADTAKSNAQKQYEIAQLNNTSNEKIATLQSETTLKNTELSGQIQKDLQGNEFAFNTDPTTGKPAWLVSLDVTKLSLINPATNKPWTSEQFYSELAQDMTKFNIGDAHDMQKFGETLAWSKEQGLLTLAQEKELTVQAFNEQVRQFNIGTAQNADQFKANLDWAKQEGLLTLDQQKELARNALTEQTREFNIGTEQNADQFKSNLEWAKEKGYLDLAQQKELALTALTEQTREFNIGTEQNAQQFKDNLTWAREKGYLDLAQEKDLATQALNEQSREFDISDTNNMKQFQANLSWAKDQFGLSQSQERELQGTALNEQVRQFDIKSNNDLRVSLQSINENMRQFDISRADQLQYNKDTIRIAQQQANDASTRNAADIALSVLDNDSVFAMLSGVEGDPLGDLVGEVFGNAMNMTPEQFDTWLAGYKTGGGMTYSVNNSTVTINGARTPTSESGYKFQIRDTTGKWYDVTADVYGTYKERGKL